MTDDFVTLRSPYLCPSEGHKHGVSIQSSLNLGDTLLGWLLIYQLSIVSQILDFILVTIFSFDYMFDENREFLGNVVVATSGN